MGARLWLDDLRPTPTGFDVRAESANEAISLLMGRDISHISFDHDLGEGGTGYEVAKFIEERASRGLRTVDSWEVHSANPVGASNIRKAMKNTEKLLTLETERLLARRSQA